ncbi:MAG: prepilin-type N-terminal cleavage/methylation domain-containing protein [Nitrospirae bacterium]|nr:prepilin-type N-terminal cleavage/methylation domain-containing protein [Nitrospirota bacterium]MCL5977852.1 prepilin-type N-terminal cleavage/methylation domain-containing protein [Nitrospirota bacterium]
MKLNHITNKRGFTLIELLIAMIILTVGIIAIAGQITSAIQGNFSAKRLTIAATCAEEKMEELKTTGYDTIASGNGTCPDFADFSRTWTVSAAGTDLKKIEVTVTWYGRTLTLSTLITKSES